ncbi:hypothetical protein [Nostoc sp.]
MSIRSQHKLFRSKRLSVGNENLSVRSQHKLFCSERLCICDKTYAIVTTA